MLYEGNTSAYILTYILYYILALSYFLFELKDYIFDESRIRMKSNPFRDTILSL